MPEFRDSPTDDAANAVPNTAQSSILKELGIQLPELDATKAIRGGNTRESKAAQWPMVQSWYVVLLHSHYSSTSCNFLPPAMAKVREGFVYLASSHCAGWVSVNVDVYVNFNVNINVNINVNVIDNLAVYQAMVLRIFSGSGMCGPGARSAFMTWALMT
jgi:hypothetical protein